MLFLQILAVLVPGLAGGALLLLRERASHRWRLVALVLVLGAFAYVPSGIAERVLERWAGLVPHARGGGVIGYIYALLVAAPLAQGLQVAAVAPVLRVRRIEAPIDGILFAGASALGFVTAHNAAYLFLRASDASPGVEIFRVLLFVPAQLFFAAAWGYVLGRERAQRIGGAPFNAAWLGAALFCGIYDHIVFGQTPRALLAALPILLAIGVLAALAARDLLRRGELEPAASRRRLLPAIAPPTLQAMREALRRAERPVVLSWILFGALVTVGVMITSIAGAVFLGHRLGMDFAAVDRGDDSASATAPLVLLSGAALFAFPVAGYLVARASRAQAVAEPALSAILAIVGTLLLLGLAAPVTVVFAVAFAPVAFGLACVGAWLGIGK